MDAQPKNFHLEHRSFTPRPNWLFNADANTGHALGVLMACVGALRTSHFGAGKLVRWAAQSAALPADGLPRQNPPDYTASTHCQ